MKIELVQPIRGIVTPLVTPLTDRDQLDVPGLERLVEHVVGGGVHGLFLLGTTGEGPSLPLELRRSLIHHTCRLVDGRVPILVGISDTVLTASLELANYSADAGCDALVATAPYYFPLPQSLVLDYFRRLARDLPLPLMLYNMPAVAGTSIELETVRQLLDLESIVGLKDSSGNLATLRQFIEAASGRPDFSIFVGPEHLLAEALALGASGGVTGGANVWPALFASLYESMLDGKDAHIAELSRMILNFGEIYQVGPVSIPAIIARTKAALEIVGICSGTTAPPITCTNQSERSQIKSILEQLSLGQASFGGLQANHDLRVPIVSN